MDIAMLSMMKSNEGIKEAASLAIMKMAMNTSEGNSNLMIDMINQNTKLMEMAVQPYLGGKLDLRA